MPKIAILDDYADAALDMADWGSLPAGFEPVVFNDNLVEHDARVDRLKDFEVVAPCGERTPFPAAVFERLPKPEAVHHQRHAQQVGRFRGRPASGGSSAAAPRPPAPPPPSTPGR